MASVWNNKRIYLIELKEGKIKNDRKIECISNSLPKYTLAFENSVKIWRILRLTDHIIHLLYWRNKCFMFFFKIRLKIQICTGKVTKYIRW